MALFDKLTEIAKNVSDKTVEIAKNVGDKTSDMLEIGKINAQISTANNSIEELKTRLGDHYWTLFTKGEKLDDDAVVLCNTIKEYVEEIESLEAQLTTLRGPVVTPRLCPNCGTENGDDALFCKNCGTKLPELEKAVAEALDETKCECGESCDCKKEDGECECGESCDCKKDEE